jgi:GntR family transcriptional activator of glc operon
MSRTDVPPARLHTPKSQLTRIPDRPRRFKRLPSFSTQPQTLYDLLDVRALLEGESARLAAMRGTDADFVLISRRYEDLRSAQPLDAPLDPVAHARLDHEFHLSICEASHNPVLVHTLRTLTDLLLSSVFAALSNLYHRMPHKQLIDDQHARLFQAVIARQPVSAHHAALDHLRGISDSLLEIEKDEQRLIRSGMRLNGWQ